MMDGNIDITPFPLPDHVVALALAGSRAVAEGGRRGAYRPSLPQIEAMAHFIAMFDPAQHAHLAQTYPDHLAAVVDEVADGRGQGGPSSPADHQDGPEAL